MLLAATAAQLSRGSAKGDTVSQTLARRARMENPAPVGRSGGDPRDAALGVELLHRAQGFGLGHRGHITAAADHRQITGRTDPFHQKADSPQGWPLNGNH